MNDIKPDLRSISDKERHKKMRKRSGDVTSRSKLVSFLYILMRDHLPAGEVEDIMLHDVDVLPKDENCSYTNGWLARYAEDLAKRLK